MLSSFSQKKQDFGNSEEMFYQKITRSIFHPRQGTLTRYDPGLQHIQGLVLLGRPPGTPALFERISEPGPLGRANQSVHLPDNRRVRLTSLPYLRDKLLEIDDIKFSANGGLLLSRDFFTAYVWDLKKPDRPLLYKGSVSDCKNFSMGTREMWKRFMKPELFSIAFPSMFLRIRTPLSQGGSLLIGNLIARFYNHNIFVGNILGNSFEKYKFNTLMNEEKVGSRLSNILGSSSRDDLSAKSVNTLQKVTKCCWNPNRNIIAVSDGFRINILEDN